MLCFVLFTILHIKCIQFSGDTLSFPGSLVLGTRYMEVKSKVDVGYHSIEEHIKTEAIRINNVLVEPNVVNVQRNLFNKSTHRKSSAKLNNVSASDQAGSHSGISVLNRELRNRTNFLAVKLENKTLNVDSSQVKNKTIEHMAVIDTAMSKGLPQITFVPSVWLLNLSFDDIGGIMKETQFLNKLDPLNMDSPILQSSRNRTANFTYAMPLKFGFCDCFERHCICYSQVVNKRLHLNKTAAFQFTFLSKTHVSTHLVDYHLFIIY